eukprot:6473558-Amphidinium_carterae.1
MLLSLLCSALQLTTSTTLQTCDSSCWVGGGAGAAGMTLHVYCVCTTKAIDSHLTNQEALEGECAFEEPCSPDVLTVPATTLPFVQ